MSQDLDWEPAIKMKLKHGVTFMDFKELLDAFAADVGMTEPVAYDNDGSQCCLEINGRGIGFCHKADAGLLVIRTEIGELPPDGLEALLARLLRENFMNPDFPEGTLSLSDDDAVCAHCTIKTPVYDKNEFYLLLLRFMTAVDEWERMLDGFAGDDSVAEETRTEEAPQPLSPTSFFQV